MALLGGGAGRFYLTNSIYINAYRVPEDVAAPDYEGPTFSAAYYYRGETDDGCDFRVSTSFLGGSGTEAMENAFAAEKYFYRPISDVLAVLKPAGVFPSDEGIGEPVRRYRTARVADGFVAYQQKEERTQIATREIADCVRLTAGLLPDGTTWRGYAKFGETILLTVLHANTKDECQAKVEDAYRRWLRQQCSEIGEIVAADAPAIKQKKELEELREFKRKVLAGTHKPIAVRPWKRERGTPVIGEEHVHLVGPAGASIIVGDPGCIDPQFVQAYAERVEKKTGHEIIVVFPSKSEEVFAVEYDAEPFRKRPW